jgi:acylglycerol lipase
MESGGGRDEMVMTSGATGRIVPVFRSVLSRRALLRLVVALQTLFLWLLLLVTRRRRAGPEASSSSEPAGTTKARRRRAAAEEEDLRRRRALAEEVAMAEEHPGGSTRRRGTFLVPGARRNALFCRLWAPAASEMRSARHRACR